VKCAHLYEIEERKLDTAPGSPHVYDRLFRDAYINEFVTDGGTYEEYNRINPQSWHSVPVSSESVPVEQDQKSALLMSFAYEQHERDADVRSDNSVREQRRYDRDWRMDRHLRGGRSYSDFLRDNPL